MIISITVITKIEPLITNNIRVKMNGYLILTEKPGNLVINLINMKDETGWEGNPEQATLPNQHYFAVSSSDTDLPHRRETLSLKWVEDYWLVTREYRDRLVATVLGEWLFVITNESEGLKQVNNTYILYSLCFIL